MDIFPTAYPSPPNHHCVTLGGDGVEITSEKIGRAFFNFMIISLVIGQLQVENEDKIKIIVYFQ